MKNKYVRTNIVKKSSWNFIHSDRNKNTPSKLIATHFECTNSRHDARQIQINHKSFQEYFLKYVPVKFLSIEDLDP